MKRIAGKESFEEFCPKLKAGSVIPHGSQIIFEAKVGKKRIILPMELADVILLSSGDYSLREIIEKILKRKGSLHFKTLFKTVHQLRAYGFFENGDQLEAYNPFGVFEGLASAGIGWRLNLLRGVMHGRSVPFLFYILSMVVLLGALSGVFQLRWPLLNSNMFGQGSGDRLFLGAFLFLASFSVISSMQAFLRWILQFLLTGQACELSLKFSPWSLSLFAGEETVFSIRNRLFLVLYHGSVAFLPLVVLSLVTHFSPESWWVSIVSNVIVIKILFDASPFSGAELVKATRNFLSLSDSDLIAGCIHDKSILNLLSPGHENRSRRLRSFFTLYIWVWSTLVLVFGGMWLKSISTAMDQNFYVFGAAWVATIASMMIVFHRLLLHAHSELKRFMVVTWLSFRGWRQSNDRSSWTMAKAQNALADLPLFSYFSPQLLEKVIRSSTIELVRSGSKIISQGEASGHLFVLLEGRLLVESKTINNERVKLSRLYPISIFGEMAIFEDSVRQADVIASDPSTILRVSALDLRKAASESHYMREIEAFKNAILVNQFFSSAPMFRELRPDLMEDIVTRSTMRFFEPNQMIFQQGEPGQSLFMLVRGSVEVSIDGCPLKIIKQGGFFGEIAVVADVPRTASVKAIGNVVVLEISAGSLWSVLSQDIELAMFIESVGESRLREDLLTISKKNTA